MPKYKIEELIEDPTWHFIELTKLEIDVNKLKSWYKDVIKFLPNLRFNFDKSEYVLPNIKSDILEGGLHSFGISWPTNKNIPIPPKYAAKPDLYPETLLDDEIFNASMRVMEIYKFGYFKFLYDQLGEEFFAWSRISIHDPGSQIKPHVDNRPVEFRIHIPIITNNNALFFWEDTAYNLKEGKAYLINTSVTHSTTNNGNTERVHLLSHPANVSWILDNFT